MQTCRKAKRVGWCYNAKKQVHKEKRRETQGNKIKQDKNGKQLFSVISKLLRFSVIFIYLVIPLIKAFLNDYLNKLE